MSKQAETLYRQGAVTFPVLTQQEVDAWRAIIEADIVGGPEVAPGTVSHVSDLQGGSFKALGTPASFHGEWVRELRLHVTRFLEGDFFFAFAKQLSLETVKVEILFDRYRSQPAGTSAGGEAYHRDESTTALRDDVILGGWLNLSAEAAQTFSYLKGTQLRVNAKGGHAKLKPTKEQLAQADTIQVPPGHLVLFYQNVIHQVHRPKGGRLKLESTRLHYGVRFTASDEPLMGTAHTDKVLTDFASPKLPSGQSADLYPKLYWVNHFTKLETLSKAFKPSILVTKKRKADDVTVVPRVLDTPAEFRLAFNPYTEEECTMYKPKKIKS